MNEHIDPSRAGGISHQATTLMKRASAVAATAAQRAVALDKDGAFPHLDIEALAHHGLLLAPFPVKAGGEGLGEGDPDRLRTVLTTVGRGSLALGRLFEGHVNAVLLTNRYGSPANLHLLRQEALAGRPSGVWMAGAALRLEELPGGGELLRGKKIYCSGAGHFRRPIVAAECDGGSIMAMPLVTEPDRADVTRWTSLGMRATATGTVDFDGIHVSNDELLGHHGDYLRSPHFRGGAWRVLAVQLGGLEAVLDTFATQLRASPHGDHPLQIARYAEAEIACETARLWTCQAARIAEDPAGTAEAIDAYVDLARNAFEPVALRVIALAQKALGLNIFLRPNPLERLVRDLATYLRQPNLDGSLLSAGGFRLHGVQPLP